jgi:hypothetical protein
VPKKTFPEAPPEWTTQTSEEHWVPSAETRAEIARLLKAAVKQPAAKRRATWAKAAKLLPPELRALTGDNAPAWGLVASHEVAAVAMKLIRYAGQEGADHARTQRELERILPDLPMISLCGVVDGQGYLDAVSAIRGREESLTDLVSYLTSS